MGDLTQGHSSHSSFHALIDLFEVAFAQVSQKYCSLDCERIAELVHQIMSAQYRTYHTVQHVLDVSSGMDAIQSIAAAFHDTVYLQVDRRVHPRLVYFTRGFEVGSDYRLMVPDATGFSDSDPAKHVFDIFGFKKGTVLQPYTGINEFLSAVCAVRILQPYLGEWDLIQLSALIEATIPFRALETTSQIRDRLTKLRPSGVSESDVERCVVRATILSNRDVSGFGDSIEKYIANTWDLAHEGNPAFRNPTYLVSHYRSALQRQAGFIGTLKPEVIFRNYQSCVGALEFDALVLRSSENMKFLQEYLQAKLVGVAVIEAVSVLTGGDAPMALFVGELPIEGQHQISALDSLLDPKIPVVKDPNKNTKIVSMLRGGQITTSHFDFKHSPIPAYLYERMTRHDLNILFKKAESFFSGDLGAQEYLSSLDKQVLKAIFFAVQRVATSRHDSIAALQSKF